MNFDNHSLIIPDVSFYQDDDATPQKIDFARMKAAGAVGVIIRAGQNTWEDEDFKDYWQAAKAAGLPRGSYWFFDSRAEPGKQATLWRAQIGNDTPELGLWADLEESYGGTWKGERNWRTFLEAVKIVFPGVRLGIYTANWWWQVQIVRDQAYFGEYPLWVSQFTLTPLYVILPKPWENKGARLWQFTDKGDGRAYGVESLNIDLNYWNGDLPSYRKYFGLAETPPPGNGGSMIFGRINTGALNVRQGPGANYMDLGDLTLNDHVVATEKVGGWWRLKDARRGSWAGTEVVLTGGKTVAQRAAETNDVWCSGAYIVEVDGPTQPPPPPPAGKTPFTLAVDGYKPFSGELEKDA